MFGPKTPSIEDQLLSIKIMTRMMKKQSDKSRKKQKTYYDMAKSETFKGDLERASIYAQQSIKHKTMSLRYLKLTMRMEVVEAMAQSAMDTGMITTGVAGIISTTAKLSDPSKVVSHITHFEQMFDNMSIAEGAVETTMDQTGGLMAPGENREVGNLLAMFAEEAAMSRDVQLPSTDALDSRNTPRASKSVSFNI